MQILFSIRLYTKFERKKIQNPMECHVEWFLLAQKWIGMKFINADTWCLNKHRLQQVERVLSHQIIVSVENHAAFSKWQQKWAKWFVKFQLSKSRAPFIQELLKFYVYTQIPFHFGEHCRLIFNFRRCQTEMRIGDAFK